MKYACALYCTVFFFCVPELKQISCDLRENSNSAAEDDNDYPVVWISDGGIRGYPLTTFKGRKVFAFEGIPYAQPPVGQRRFKEPERSSPWKGIRDGFSMSPACIHTDFFQMYMIVGQEDCLYLNVYTPKVPATMNEGELLPVLIGIHHGGFIFGSTHLMGPTYLMDQNVVLVTMNYRLGALGFMSTGDEAIYGNNGLKDQVLAMKWVQKNIRAFGGDPNSVTLFGESAGAGSTHFHMLSPLTRGLFHRGISQSGCAFCFWSINENPMRLTTTIASAFKCPLNNTMDMVECLWGVNATDFVNAQLLMLEWASYPVALVAPVIEPKHPGAYLDDLPENIYKKPNAVAKVPWIVGVNGAELAINVGTILLSTDLTKEFNVQWTTKVGPVMMELKDSTDDPQATLAAIWDRYMGSEQMDFDTRKQAVQMLSDRYLAVCTHKAIRYHAEYTGMPVYAYYMNYTGQYSVLQMIGQDPKEWGPTHMDDLIYLVNNTAYYSTLQPNDEEYKMSQMMTSMWANFAAHGYPSDGTSQAPAWDPVLANTTANLKFLSLKILPEMIQDPFIERVRFWDSLRLKEGDYETTQRATVLDDL